MTAGALEVRINGLIEEEGGREIELSGKDGTYKQSSRRGRTPGRR